MRIRLGVSISEGAVDSRRKKEVRSPEQHGLEAALDGVNRKAVQIIGHRQVPGDTPQKRIAAAAVGEFELSGCKAFSEPPDANPIRSSKDGPATE